MTAVSYYCRCCEKTIIGNPIYIWTPGWITCKDGPQPYCEQHKKLFSGKEFVFNEEADKRFKLIKFVNEMYDYRDGEEFLTTQRELITRGSCLKGGPRVQLTCLTRLLYYYKSEHWLLSKYHCVNFGADTFWIDKLEWR